MAFRSQYEMQKWKQLQAIADAPLKKVLSGNYTRQDVAALGKTLKGYDELAHSILDEGLRVIEESAKAKVSTIQEHRIKYNKQPLSAKQLAIIYGQAVEKQHKAMLPDLLATVKDVLEAQSLGTQNPVGEQSPLDLKRYTMSRFTPKDAANDTAELKSKQLIADLSDKQEEHGSAIQDVLAMLDRRFGEQLEYVQALTTDLEKMGSKLDELLERYTAAPATSATEPQSVLEEPNTQVVPAIAKVPEPAVPEAEKTSIKTTKAERKQEKQRREREKEKARKAKEVERKAAEARYHQGLLHSPISKAKAAGHAYDTWKANKKKAKAKREADIKSGKVHEGVLHRAVRVAKNTKNELGEVTDYLKSKYSKLTRSLPSGKSAGMGLLGLALLPTLFKSALEGFTESFNTKAFMDSVVDPALDSIYKKVMSLVGLDKDKNGEDAIDRAANAVGLGPRSTTGEDRVATQLQGVGDSALKTATAVNDAVGTTKRWDKRRIQNRMGLDSYTPAEAAQIKQQTGITIPAEYIITEGPGTRVMKGKITPSSSATAQSSGGSAPSSSSTVAVTPPSSTQVVATAPSRPTGPVVATPPPKVADDSRPTQGEASKKPLGGGSAPISSASIPEHGAVDSSLILNTTNMTGN